MKYFDWDPEKNISLQLSRGVSFEDMLVAFEDGNLLDVINHGNQKKYPQQKVLIIALGNYAYMVPFVEDEEKYFLKTIIPSRKFTKKYLTSGGKNV